MQMYSYTLTGLHFRMLASSRLKWLNRVSIVAVIAEFSSDSCDTSNSRGNTIIFIAITGIVIVAEIHKFHK